MARCPVFQQSLNDPNIQSLSFSTINLPALHGFVEWLYFGQIKDMSKQIDQLLELANTYKIDDLRVKTIIDFKNNQFSYLLKSNFKN